MWPRTEVQGGIVPHSLALVSSVAGQLLEATASTAAQVSGQVLARLVEQFDLDYSFLRHNDHDIGASVLVAEWPPRPNVPDPDPLAVVHFSSADPVLALGERGKKSIVIKPDQMERAYQHWIAERHHAASPMVAVAPLFARQVTTGALGVVKFGAKKWKPEVINTLEALACVFAGVQARIAAEQKLRDLADHDDLTGLRNRRALVAHLADRLAAGRPGPVPLLYLDLDRLKAINDCFGHTVGDWFIQIFAERLRTSAENLGMIARLGGDEFVVVPDRPMSIDTAELFADQLLTTVRDRLLIGGHTITRTVSIGVAVGVPGSDDGTDLLHRADEPSWRPSARAATRSRCPMTFPSRGFFATTLNSTFRAKSTAKRCCSAICPRSTCGAAPSSRPRRSSVGGTRREGCCYRIRSSV